MYKKDNFQNLNPNCFSNPTNTGVGYSKLYIMVSPYFKLKVELNGTSFLYVNSN